MCFICGRSSCCESFHTVEEQERFAGQGILSETGVSYDTQIAVAQPDTIHYALTSAGLVRIASGNPEFVHTEVSDYVVENSQVVALYMLDGRYLFMTTTDDLKPAKVEVDVVQVVDHENDAYSFLPTQSQSAGGSAFWEMNAPSDWATYKVDSPFTESSDSNTMWEIPGNIYPYIYSAEIYDIADGFYGPLAISYTIDLEAFCAMAGLSAGDQVTISLTGHLSTRPVDITNPSATMSLVTKSGLNGAQVDQTVSVWDEEVPIDFEVLYTIPAANEVYAWPHYRLIYANGGRIGVIGGSVLRIDTLKIESASGGGGGGGLSKVGEAIKLAVQGSLDMVQNGFANFSVSSVSDATFVKRNEVPLVPCYIS